MTRLIRGALALVASVVLVLGFGVPALADEASSVPLVTTGADGDGNQGGSAPENLGSTETTTPPQPQTVTATVAAKVKISGHALSAGEFTFNLREVSTSNGQPNWSNPGKVLQTAKNDASGNVSFQFSLTGDGARYYLLEQVAGNQKYTTYDSSRVRVVVDVLGADVVVTSENGKLFQAPVFSNTYKKPTPVWRRNSTGWWLAYPDGSYPANCWDEVGGKRYAFNAAGYMRSGWFYTGGAWYWLGSANDGAMKTGWQRVGGKWYLMGADGKMLTGWQKVGGKSYYLTSSGAMATGWLKSGNTWYYLDSSGAMRTGWIYTGGKWYLLGSDGKMLTGWQKVGGTYYYLTGSGAMATGWLKSGNTWYYLDSSGAMRTGWQYIGGSWYYMNKDGAMQANCWIDDLYYVGSSGAMYANRWTPDGYYVDGSGRWVASRGQSSVASSMLQRAQGYSSRTSWLLLVNTTANEVGVYQGSKGSWKPVKQYQVSTGAASSPTIRGEFSVGAKGYSFGENKGYSCYYYTQFYGDYLFHSIKYYPGTRNVKDGRLGLNISQGCVRMNIDEAKWIQDNIPVGSKVVVY